MAKRGKGAKKKGISRRLAGLIVIIGVIGISSPFLLRSVVMEAFKIPTATMLPTIAVGEHIFVSKSAYGIRVPVFDTWLVRWSGPDRGDVIVFRNPVDPSTDYIKRVVAIPGDVVRFDNADVFINGQKLARSEPSTYEILDPRVGSPTMNRYTEKNSTGSGKTVEYDVIFEPKLSNRVGLGDGTRLTGMTCKAGDCRVDPGFVFVLGDNRDNSVDSRTWGGVPVEYIKGRYWFTWFRPN